MRLGGYLHTASSVEELDSLCGRFDSLGLSTIPVPEEAMNWSDGKCEAYGQKARDLGIFLGEIGFWGNMMTADAEIRERRIRKVRTLLQKAERMGCPYVVTLVGSVATSDQILAPHPYMLTEACRMEFREVALRILDGFEGSAVKYLIEPWSNTFFFHPEDILSFLDAVDHPSLGFHLDLMNMIGRDDYFDTKGLIERTFHLLRDKIGSVHLKDLRWDPNFMVLKWEETPIGEGIVDYDSYLRMLDGLPSDTPCFCEHRLTEEDYERDFHTLHSLALRSGTEFVGRGKR